MQQQQRRFSEYERKRLRYLFSEKIEKYLDANYGDCWLKIPEIAQLVVNALGHFDGIRYHLFAWCIMPNHVHVIFKPISSGSELQSDLISILHSWKSFTAHKANKILKRSGEFWQSEYYDHVIRSDEELHYYITYTLNNPVKAALCDNWEEWPWSGCSEAVKKGIEQSLAGETPAPHS
ncbi:MAG TPA: transposase [Acidobacteriota bacterium]|nr:transposase [Acidobacteriota bacterium]